ncbi:hypothetical protein [Variovorax sp. dw_954]|uniref:hypothetical protein n=1 Tax=Variovorax sp. dw_954 TaxID=2720078 RepID=UPI00211677A5|nr:hypothetical protein [Variovorax sp. dw_954]
MRGDLHAGLDWSEKDRIRNDLALAQLRAGDHAGCLKTLEPLREAAGQSDNDIRSNYLPEEARLLLPIVRATRTNLKLCQG